MSTPVLLLLLAASASAYVGTEDACLAKLKETPVRCVEVPFCPPKLGVGADGTRQYRLVGDASCSAGWVQWKIRGHSGWHQLCDTTAWTDADAKAVCATLGFRYGSAELHAVLPYQGLSSLKPRAFGITCTGVEADIEECRFDGQVWSEDENCPGDSHPLQVSCW